MPALQVNSSQQPSQLNSTGQANESRPDSSFRGRVCAAAKTVVNNIGFCSACIASEALICAAYGYYQGENNTQCTSSMAYLGGVIGAGSAAAFCLVGSYLIGSLESLPDKTAGSARAN